MGLLKYNIIPFLPQYISPLQQLLHLSIRYSFNGLYSKRIIEFFVGYHSASETLKRSRQGLTLVAIQDGKFIGTGNISFGYMNALYVHPYFQYKGIGSEIFQCLMIEAKRISLPEVIIDATLGSLEFYESKGFELIDKRADIIEPEGEELWYYKMKLKL